jgi:acyl-CoA thioester hydrolase
MSRNRITFPDHFPFSTTIPVRITDINYGNHLGNDKVLTLAHEARMRFLSRMDVEEMAIGDGAGLIMASAELEFRSEVRYGDELQVSVAVTNISRAAFDLIYRFVAVQAGKEVLAAAVSTGMVCFDYEKKKVVSIPATFRDALSGLQRL